MWLRHHEPRAVSGARWALQPKDWLRWRLTDEVHSEPSDASATLLYDVSGDRWDDEAVDLLGLDASMLAPLLPWSGYAAGRLSVRAAAELGLPPGIVVAAGAGDTAAALFGSGLSRDGSVQMTVGTGGQVVMALDAPAPAVGAGTTLFRSAASRGWYAMAATTNAGLSLEWVRATLGLTWEELYAAAAGPAEESAPFFLPHLSGERTPWLDARMRGAWTELDLAAGRRDLARAALEGVAFAMSLALDALAPAGIASVRMAGGGTTNDMWRQMFANVLGLALDAVEVPGASARGAALLGGCAGGHLDESAVFGALTPAAGRVAEPVPSEHAVYAARRGRWLSQVEALRSARGSA